ncbi:hypothetical protein [Convivina intestini]|uniref:Uncharacterized protein n=1 Tax=Convivina intestini TaxID=1505726 RepID=A0A2U1D4D0_9LACO|nr:hypothetical protein [Convivina intestini]PVY82533.1 hypothetical protein C7384_1125 [Convivina intestini]SDC17591.1 hypothetical protein SAMN05216341_11722 [Leuconostocaceae bacterium R-53105]
MEIKFVVSLPSNGLEKLYEKVVEVDCNDNLIPYFNEVTIDCINSESNDDWPIPKYLGESHTYFLFDQNGKKFNYNLDKMGGVEYQEAFDSNANLTANTLIQFSKDGLFDWDGETIRFSPVSGLGAGGGPELDWLNALSNVPWKCIFECLGHGLSVIELIEIIKNKFTSRDDKRILRQDAEAFNERGMTSYRLYDFILKRDGWDKNKLVHYLRISESDLGKLMCSLGYMKKQRGRIYVKNNTKSGDAMRKRWYY